MELKDAINLLKKTVKESAVPGQRHLDFGLVNTSERQEYEKALAKVHKAIYDQEITKEQFESLVGLI